MPTMLCLAIGGIVGVYARYGITLLIQSLCGQGFPVATLVINLLGSFLLAFLFIETLDHLTLSPAIRAGILTGGLGAFTTFSTFIMESVTLIQEGQSGKAALYIILSVGGGLLVAFAGVYLARHLM